MKTKKVSYFNYTVEVPLWTRCIAMDANGDICAYDGTEVSISKSQSGRWFRSFKLQFREIAKGGNKLGIDWKKSKVIY